MTTAAAPAIVAGYDSLIRAEVWLVPAALVEVGDVLVVLSRTLRVDRIEPYDFTGEPHLRGLYGPGSRVAHCGPDFAITLTEHHALGYRVLPRPGQPAPAVNVGSV